ncbi:hypothetical protein THJ086_04550 [Campylobacter jejuni]|uniref:hypothetical protein n=1 Tax=Campylobacter jejuni TaxID=197 RepID=UPI00207BC75A|nr:hypothetical protein [Campylobacter jejuni]GKY57914.1 hypothetical protein THJ086_04550 [Campylobacter jejuni]
MKLEENSQFGFMLDQSKCVGCRTCSLSCKDYKNMPVGINFRRVFETEGGGGIGQLKKMGVLSKVFLLTTLLFLAIIVLIHLVLKLVQLAQQ